MRSSGNSLGCVSNKYSFGTIYFSSLISTTYNSRRDTVLKFITDTKLNYFDKLRLSRYIYSTIFSISLRLRRSVMQ